MSDETTTATATSTSESTASTVISEVESTTHSIVAEKIQKLAAEIVTTDSIWVKIRNAGEIGLLSFALVKAVSELEKSK